MNTSFKKTFLAAVVMGQLALGSGYAGSVKTYQVTGPVLEVSDTAIVIQKGKDRWEIARTAETKITGDLKVGAKVTIEYQMTATTATVKPAK